LTPILTYISGYKPAYNYQQLLKETVESYISTSAIEQASQQLIAMDPVTILDVDWENVLTEPPEMQKRLFTLQARDFMPAKYNFTKQESINRALGQKGEEFILKYEQNRLVMAGREDLAKEIEWTSEVHGDGAGYDIRSFNPANDDELFIEVKTTKLGKYLPFYISGNEVEFSRKKHDHYSLYRVYDFKRDPKLFMLNGDVSQHVNLHPTTYRASF